VGKDGDAGGEADDEGGDEKSLMKKSRTKQRSWHY
jgi:hypothetical protein